MAVTRKKTSKQTGKKTISFTIIIGNGILKVFQNIWNAILRIKRQLYRFIMHYYYKWKYSIPEPQRRKHTLIIGATGSGKSEFMKTLMHQHILRGKTAVIGFDPNWDFSEQVAQFKENAWPQRKRKLVYINPSEFDDVFPVINPLDLPNVSTGTLDKVTQALFKTMEQSFKELDLKLTGAMAGMLYNMLHTLYRKKGSSLIDLVRFVDDNLNADLVQLWTETNNYVIKDYFMNKFINPSLSVTKVGLANRVNNFLAAQSLQRLIVGKTTVNLQKEINKRNTIIFNLSKGKLWPKVSKIYGRFILTTLLNLTLARADIEEEYRVPCHFYIDEFHNFLSDTFIEVFAEWRKYKVYLTVATQVIGLGMTPDVKKAVLWNCNVKILGKAGYQSRDEMMKQMSYRDTFTLRKKWIRKWTFSKLMTGRFIVQYGISRPFKIKVPKFLLWNKHSMSDQKREKILEDQRKANYILPFYVTNPIPMNTFNNNPFESSRNRPSFLQERKTLLGDDEKMLNSKRKFRRNLN